MHSHGLDLTFLANSIQTGIEVYILKKSNRSQLFRFGAVKNIQKFTSPLYACALAYQQYLRILCRSNSRTQIAGLREMERVIKFAFFQSQKVYAIDNTLSRNHIISSRSLSVYPSLIPA